MSIALSQEERMLKDLVAKFVRDELMPLENKVLARDAAGEGMAFTKEELVSNDFIGDPHSSTVDSKLTQVIGGNLVAVQAWYDNEMGFSHRMVDLAKIMAKGL